MARGRWAAEHPERVEALRERLMELAGEQAPPLFTEATAAVVGELPPALPTRVR